MVQFCQVAEVPKCISTWEGNGDKVGFGFSICIVLMCLDGVTTIQVREEVGGAVWFKKVTVRAPCST